MIQPGTASPGRTSLDEWLTWLETLSPTEIALGLDRVTAVLDRLRPARAGRVVVIAGTNGKGSCAAMLEALFMRRGESVGTYISPHISRYNERIRLDAVPARDEEIISAFERVESARRDVTLTYFEFGTLAALVIFEERNVDAVILEVGMGGKLDAVNAIEPDAGIITNVSLDHCDWLGEDIESIAAEKAGILRSDKPFVFGASEIPQAILAKAERLGTDLWLRGRDYDFEAEAGSDTWSWSGRRTRLSSLVTPGLAGRFQLQNAAAVLALVEAMQLDELLDKDVIDSTIGRIELAGRCQRIRTDRNWLLDVAHNAEAAKALSEHLGEIRPTGDIVAVIGMLADKDQAGVIAPLDVVVDHWIAVRAESGRAVPAAKLAQTIANLCDKPVLISDSLADAMRHGRESTTENDLIVVTGSFYVVGPALEWLGRGTIG
jgi:dihydrofolate synthase/folylpolyglutamate synthase